MGMGNKWNFSDDTTKLHCSYLVRWYFQSTLFDQILNLTRWNNWWTLWLLWTYLTSWSYCCRRVLPRSHSKVKKCNIVLWRCKQSSSSRVILYCWYITRAKYHWWLQKRKIIPWFEIANYVDEILLALLTQNLF